jgi:small multidrug resistance pump
VGGLLTKLSTQTGDKAESWFSCFTRRTDWHRILISHKMELLNFHMAYALTTTFYLFLAIVLEVAGTTSMKLSDGFQHWQPSICIFVFYALSFFFLNHTLKRLPITVAYAVWSGLGTLLVAVIGIIFFSEPLSSIKILSLACIISGVVGLKASQA